MKCPNCQTPLSRVHYEGFPVRTCAKCRGYLLSPRRLESLLRTPESGVEALEEQVDQQTRDDLTDVIKCPRCRIKMKKQPAGEALDFSMDVCKSCDVIWLDGGELAKLQLLHQSSAEMDDNQRFRQRWAEMSDEDRAEFERNLAAMPEGSLDNWSAIVGGVGEMMVRMERANRRC